MTGVGSGEGEGGGDASDEGEAEPIWLVAGFNSQPDTTKTATAISAASVHPPLSI